MGNFLSQFNVLVNRDGDSNVPDVQLDFESKLDRKTCFFPSLFLLLRPCSSTNLSALDLEIIDSQLTDDDTASYSHVLHMLEPTADLLELLRTYEGCGDYIRQVG